MPPQISQLLIAMGGAISWGLVQPSAATLVGGFVAGFAIGASKNRTAVIELARGLFFGLGAGAAVWVTQQLLGGAV